MEEKREEPTSRKIARAKESRGGAYSLDLVHSLLILAALVFLYFYSSHLLERFKMAFYWRDPIDPLAALKAAFSPLLFFLITLFLLLSSLAVAAFIFQRGWAVKRGARGSKEGGYYKLFYALIKGSCLILLAYLLFSKVLPKAQERSLASFQEQTHFIFHEPFIMTLLVTLCFFLLSIFDLAYKKWRFFRSLKMSRAEIKEEEREEGGRKK